MAAAAGAFTPSRGGLWCSWDASSSSRSSSRHSAALGWEQQRAGSRHAQARRPQRSKGEWPAQELSDPGGERQPQHSAQAKAAVHCVDGAGVWWRRGGVGELAGIGRARESTLLGLRSTPHCTPCIPAPHTCAGERRAARIREPLCCQCAVGWHDAALAQAQAGARHEQRAQGVGAAGDCGGRAGGGGGGGRGGRRGGGVALASLQRWLPTHAGAVPGVCSSTPTTPPPLRPTSSEQKTCAGPQRQSSHQQPRAAHPVSQDTRGQHACGPRAGSPQ